MSGIFLLGYGNFTKNLNFSSLVSKIEENMQKDSKIIIKVQDEYEKKSQKTSKIPENLEEEKIILPSKLTDIDYVKNYSRKEIYDKFIEMRGFYKKNMKFIQILIDSKHNFTEILPEKDNFDEKLSKHENFLLMGGAQIYGENTQGILLFDGTIFSLEKPNVLQKEDPIKNMPFINLEDLKELQNNKNPMSLQKILLSASRFYKEQKLENISDIFTTNFNNFIMEIIEGDFSFIYIDLLNSFILFGKDRFGKKSLLLHDEIKNLNQFCITSIPFLPSNYKEIIGNSLISINLQNSKVTLVENAFPASTSRFFNTKIINEPEKILSELEITLINATKKRILPALGCCLGLKEEKNAKIAVMFSGGIDSLLLAYLVHKILPEDEIIDLINLAFEDLASDRITSLIGLYELRQIAKGRKFRYIAIDVEKSELEKTKSLVENLIFPQNTVMDLSIGTALFYAVKGKGNTFSEDFYTCKFDSFAKTILDEFPKIYTENKGGKGGEIKVAAQKNPNFMASYTQIKSEFKIPVESQAQTVLNGLGADEIFGGYSRYYTYLKNEQFSELIQEISLDLDRLWIRNFGRDDRCVNFHTKTCVFPYLDLSVLEFASQLPIHALFYKDELYKLNKKPLRDLAQKIGFKISPMFAKKAIQFGTKVANQYNKIIFSSHRKAKGWKKYNN